MMAAAHVLLIDDDPVFSATLSRSLQRKGFDVQLAADSTAALHCVEQKNFDLILLDLNLNGESGLKLLQQILQQQPAARIVMLTAYASVATAVDAIKRGAENYLCKPVNARDIAALLQHSKEEPPQHDDANVNDNPLSMDRLEWEHLQRVLMENNGNISATARALNMHRRTLQRKLQKRPVAK